MRAEIADIYRRAWGLMRAMPLVPAIVLVAELIRHAAEIRMGLYVHRGELSADDHSLRLAVGMVRSLVSMATLLFALRWFRFGGDMARAMRLDLLLVRGIIITLAVELGGEALLTILSLGIAQAGHVEVGSFAWMLSSRLPTLVWAMLSVLLFPWFTGLLADDPEMGPKRSIMAIYPMWGACFLLYVAGVLPLTLLRYGLGFAALSLAPPWLWGPLIVEAAAAALVPVVMASTYYAVYLRARA